MVQCVRRWHAPADAVAAGDGDVNLRRVDIAQLIELQRRLVGEDAARPSRPERRLHVGVETARRRQREAVQTRPATLNLPSLGHAHEGHRVDAQPPRVVWRHEAVPLVGDLGKLRVGTSGYMDKLAQNRLVCPSTFTVCPHKQSHTLLMYDQPDVRGLETIAYVQVRAGAARELEEEARRRGRHNAVSGALAEWS